MLNTKKIKMIHVLVFALLALAFYGKAMAASDLDIFDMTPEDVQPNVLIVLDLSGSMMSNKDVPNATGANDYRLNVAKAVLENLLSNEANKKVRWGLMTFPYTSGNNVMGGGRLIAECKPRVFDVVGNKDGNQYAGANGVRDLIRTINGLSANGGTPVASALAEAGLYFAGRRPDGTGGSFFWTGSYKTSPTLVRTSTGSSRMPYPSPIQNECQNNYIILVTDGFSSVDTGKMGTSYYNTNSTAKYNASTWNNSIFFMEDYLPGVKIDGNKDPNDKTSTNTYGYITWKSKYAPEGQRENIGKQLEDVVITWKWSPYDSVRNPNGNKLVSTEVTSISNSYMSVGSYNSSSPYLQWHNIVSGVPFAKGHRLDYNYVYQLFKAKEESDQDGYKYGYNADDPSLSIPPFPVSYTTSNSGVKTTSIPLYNQGYINGTQIFQGNQWEAGYFASDYLDDVAALLYNEDLRPDMGTGTKYEKQRVKTYVIGFRFSSDLLDRAAIMGSGGAVDKAMTADAYDELETALNTIMTSIREEMAVFVSPSLPASGDNENYTGKILYMGLFKPSEGFWIGNLKRYELNDDNNMSDYLDANGAIKPSAKSSWNPGSPADGSDVTMGGVTESLNKVLASMVGVSNTKDLRNVYTYTNAGENELWHANNLFIETNPKLTPAMLDLETPAELKSAITSIRLTPMGAVLHSAPVMIYHGTEKVVYVGANDGFLHAFYDQDSHVTEAWAFVMPEHLKTIKINRDEYINPNSGVYYADGPIAVKNTGSSTMLIAGARRGGNNYVALNVTNFNQPVFKYEITAENVGWSIGQSWGLARFIDDGEYVLLPGGYDDRYDTGIGKNVSGAKGAGIIGLSASNGSPNDRFNSLHGGMMQHSILDFAILDSNSDASIDSIYYGDLGGRLFYATNISISDRETVGGSFTPYLLFKTDINDGRKFMSAPALLKASGIEYVYFGSGDRESPLDKEVLNRFYCVKNFFKYEEGHFYWDTSLTGDNHLSEGKMYDASLNLAGSEDETTSTNAKTEMDGLPGWYFDLEKGEKVIGTAAFKEYVIFTTYQPEYDEMPDPTDICKSGGSDGKARMYIINYLYGTGTLGEKSNERSVVIGNTIPSAPVISIFQVDDITINAKVTVTVGLEDIHGNQSIGVIMKDLGEYSGTRGNLDVFYWREIF